MKLLLSETAGLKLLKTKESGAKRMGGSRHASKKSKEDRGDTAASGNSLIIP